MNDPVTPAPVPDPERGGPSTIPSRPAPASTTGNSRAPIFAPSSVAVASRRLTPEEFRAAMDWPVAAARQSPCRILDRKSFPHRSGFAGEVHQEERRAVRMYNIMNWVLNLLLITQAAVLAVLVALGSTGNMYRVPIAVLGGVNGISTGALSTIKGQGIPNRYWQYASGLRSVSAKAEALERRVQAGGVVTQEDLELLWQMYEDVQHQYDINNPDVSKAKPGPVYPYGTEAAHRSIQPTGAAEIAEPTV
jgi:SMODS and SLOG-associating 2TM effector domain